MNTKEEKWIGVGKQIVSILSNTESLGRGFNPSKSSHIIKIIKGWGKTWENMDCSSWTIKVNFLCTFI